MNREHEAEADRLIRELNERSVARRAAEAVEESVAGDPLERGVRTPEQQAEFDRWVKHYETVEGMDHEHARFAAAVTTGELPHGDVVYLDEDGRPTTRERFIAREGDLRPGPAEDS